MEVKIDTKEKFTVITPELGTLDDNLAAQLSNIVNDCMQKEVKNVVLNMENVTSVEEEASQALAELQQRSYEQNASFVICSLQEPVEKQLDEFEVLEIMNVTPTESEAWDIVQMEEIERELLDADDIEFEKND